MTVFTKQQATARADRALELLEQGLDHEQIKERLGISSSTHLGVMIQRARKRREKAQHGARHDHSADDRGQRLPQT